MLINHPDILQSAVEQHRDDLIREAAAARLAAQLAPARIRRDDAAFPPIVAPLNLLVDLARRPAHAAAHR